MTTEPVSASQPKHPLYALTTYELRNWRRELERAIEMGAPDAPVQTELGRQLDAAIAEQEDRARLAHG